MVGWKSFANVVLGVLPCVLGFHGGSHPHGIASEFLFGPKRSEGMLMLRHVDPKPCW